MNTGYYVEFVKKNSKLILNKKLEITDEKDFGNNPPRPVA